MTDLTENERLMLADFLDTLSGHMSNAACNDWKWPKGVTVEERRTIVLKYEDWNSNSDPEEVRCRLEHDLGEYGPADLVMVGYLRARLMGEIA